MREKLTISWLANQLAKPTTRFAPSPTGHLHLGHIASAIYTWGVASMLPEARIFVRLEDHDRSRCRLEYEESIIADLAWLGFTPSNRDFASRPSNFRQSDCGAHYEEALLILKSKALVYACDCSRKRIAAAAREHDSLESLTDAATEQRYDGHCRRRGLPLDAPNVSLRLNLEKINPIVQFEDVFLGTLCQNVRDQCGDIMIRDRLGQWTYQFAVVVDDIRHGVNLIIRGQDLTESTGRQIILANLLGRKDSPIFGHHPLLLEESGKKLSKRFFSESVSSRRARGEDAKTILGEATWQLGFTATAKPIEVKDIGNLLKQFYRI